MWLDSLDTAIAGRLSDLSRQAFPDRSVHWQVEDLIAFAESPTGAIFCDREVRAGLLLLQSSGDEAEVIDLGVVPAHRRSGIGGALLSEAMHHAAREGARTMSLEVAEDNAAARGLYGKAGFATVGRRRDYYRGKDGARTDALILSCGLGGAESC